MSNNTSTFIVIPAYNESKVIGAVIDAIKKEGYDNIIVVDDGSADNTFGIVRERGCIALKHLVNRGKGAATQTGLDAAKLLGAKYVVTIDADGQHNPKEIKSLLDPLLGEECDVVLGSRLLSKTDMPVHRKVMNVIGNILTYIFYGIYVSDSQSGFRAYNGLALDLIKTTFDRYEFESEIIHQVKIHKLSYAEVPITVTYSDYSRNKWRHLQEVSPQGFLNGFKMFFRMVIKSITT